VFRVSAEAEITLKGTNKSAKTKDRVNNNFFIKKLPFAKKQTVKLIQKLNLISDL
jgi:hypothetical protein